jgi:hypothetical protein
MKDYPTALEYYLKALPVCERNLGPDHPDTANIYCKIGDMYILTEDYPKA